MPNLDLMLSLGSSALAAVAAVGAAAALAAGVAALSTQLRPTEPVVVVAGALGPSVVQAADAYLLPLPGSPTVARPFVAPIEVWAPGHRGVDLRGEIGTAVLAPADGTVAFAGTVVGRGVVTLAHADGLRSSLEPVDYSVGAGERVLRGQQVGTIQATRGHCAPDGCLHWGVRRGHAYLDPLTLLEGAGPVVLLPGSHSLGSGRLAEVSPARSR